MTRLLGWIIGLSLVLSLPSVAAPGGTTELGGRVVEQASGLPFPSPVPVLLRLSEPLAPFEGLASQLEARPGLDGHFVLELSPGTYQAEVWLGGQLAHSELLMLTPGSHWKEFRIVMPFSESAPLVARATGRPGGAHSLQEGTGTGGSGTALTPDPAGLPGHFRLAPELEPLPDWLREGQLWSTPPSLRTPPSAR
jgi:hypothetical protein